MFRDTDAAAIRKLPWVQSVVKVKSKNYPGYVIRTKPGTLKTRVTHGTLLAPGWVGCGNELKEPFDLALPSYLITIKDFQERVRVRLALKPELPHPVFLPLPAADLQQMESKRWSAELQPCFGVYWRGTYQQNETWLERAEYMAIYLQTALNYRSYNRDGSRYAYFMGKMPQEYVRFVPTLPEKRSGNFLPGGQDIYLKVQEALKQPTQ